MYSFVCLAGSSTKAGDCYSCQYFDCEHNLITAILKCVYLTFAYYMKLLVYIPTHCIQEVWDHSYTFLVIVITGYVYK